MLVSELNQRSRDIFRRIVDAYLDTGEPIGSRTLSKRLPVSLSPATIRNVMADLEEAGLLSSPHTSAGRIPTDLGLRLFVDGLLEVGDLTEGERKTLGEQFAGTGASVEGLLEKATSALSGLTHCASLVSAPRTEGPLKHIEFVSLSPGRTLVVLVRESGLVENRVIETPRDLPASALVQATNYLSARLVGRSVAEAHDQILAELKGHEAELDELVSRVVGSGLATWAGDEDTGSLIVRGQANLLDDVQGIGDLDQIRSLFAALETKELMVRLLSQVDRADDVQIFIGADNNLFDVSGCAVIVSPYRDHERRIIGAIGVIGPTRINYARIIPMVDYTAKLVSRMMG